MDQHLKDQIEYILESFNFGKVQRVMTRLDWTWYDEALSPRIERLRNCARGLLQFVAQHDAEDTSASSGGFSAEKSRGRHLSLHFTIESMCGADAVENDECSRGIEGCNCLKTLALCLGVGRDQMPSQGAASHGDDTVARHDLSCPNRQACPEE